LSEEYITCDHNIPIEGISSCLVNNNTFLIISEKWLDLISSAPLGGELRQARHIINHTVKKGYSSDHPERDLARLADEMGLGEGVVGLMTAVDVRRTAVRSESKGNLTVTAVCTAGTSHPCAAGVPVIWDDNSLVTPGTINIVVLIDGRLTEAAMVNAVITATEAKTRAICMCGITMPDGSMATGTTTDTVVIACTGRGKPLPYAGAATDLGYLIGHTVYQAVEQGLKDYLAEAE
jgi:iron complex transport system ATP-binding protein